MSPERGSETAAAQAVLAQLAGGGAGGERPAGVGDDDIADVLCRLYLEGFGLLAYAVPPAAPDPETRSRLLERLAGDDTQEVEPLPAAAAADASGTVPPESGSGPEPELAAAPLPPAAPVAPAELTQQEDRPRVRRAAPPDSLDETWARSVARPRRRRWPGVLAALFALAALGAGAWAVYLQSELQAARARAARAERALAGADRAHLDAVAAARAEAVAVAEELRFVTAPGVVIWSLRPPVGSRQPAARATLFVAADGRRWRLVASGLATASAGADYQLWFLADGVPRSAGVFAARGGAAHASGEILPPDMDGVAVTLERAGGARAPTGAFLLAADSAAAF